MIRPGGSRSLASLIVVLASACDGPVEPGACSPPSVNASAISVLPTNVIAAAVNTGVTSADRVIARYSRAGDAGHEVTPSFDAASNTLTIPILGLHPETQYTVSVVAYNECGSSAGEPLSVTTGSLPADLPRFSASGSDPAPGFRLPTRRLRKEDTSLSGLIIGRSSTGM